MNVACEEGPATSMAVTSVSKSTARSQAKLSPHLEGVSIRMREGRLAREKE